MSRRWGRGSALGAVMLAVVLALGATACGGGDDDGNSGAAGGAVDRTTTSSSDDSGSGSATSTPGAGSDSGSSGIDADLFEGPEPTNDGPGGEGCSPGEVDHLPDGWWAGEITAVDGPSIEFDLVCWYDGDAALAAAAEDGEEVNNDYYVRDSNPRTFTETFADRTGPATCVEAGSPESFPCTIDDVLHLYPATYETVTIDGHEASAYPIVWLHVTDAAPDYLFLRFTP